MPPRNYMKLSIVIDPAEFANEIINVKVKSQVYTTKALLARKTKAAIISVTSNS